MEIERRRYVYDPLGPFPKRWRDRHGEFKVMCEPVKGYVMARRPRTYPFVISVAELMNAQDYPTQGPFECLERTRK